jgi:gamma-glutamylaminecyclotransferase
MTLIFAYGSLRRGCSNHAYLEWARLVVPEARIAGLRLIHYVEGFPAVVWAATGEVAGEIYEVSPEELGRLDELEECPTVYFRAVVSLHDGRPVQAYLATAPENGEAFPGASWPIG